MSNKIQLGDTLNPALDYSGVPAVDGEADFGKQEKQMRTWQHIFQIYFQ